ncbi:MAG TPA: FAD-linked oxidase C-terminal domain-containing protein [Anaeromyxobacteraceae bacterium]|nr:FAD-linked oxidase C-terminal domain-containing protein [Anaeromyxobacteraceae bacterium]
MTTAARRRVGDPALAARLRRELEGEVLFDPFSRGRYSTDASIYQVEPLGVVVPRHEQDLVAAVQIAAEEGVPLLARGGGTSQCGQTVGEALVLDCSKHLTEVISLDVPGRRAVVQPGLVLDALNARLRPEGLWFPIDVSTSAMATLGGMAGNNSCGTRSLRYGNMVHNVAAIDAVLADGTLARMDEGGQGAPPALVDALRALHRREAEEIAARFPKVRRRVGGYNLDRLAGDRPNLAGLLVGSEGTLALSRRIELALHPIPRHKVLGVCHFPSFRKAMESTGAIVGLGPAAVELVDRTMIELGRAIPIYRALLARFVRGEPEALLLVEFAGDDRAAELTGLKRLGELMGDLGLPGAVLEAVEPAFQAQIWEVRKAGLNIMMSMRGDRKPVSFIEDCAVPLPHLADYTERLTALFARHGTTGTWYAHASEGCLHVRPVLNLKADLDVRAMRAIAEEAFAIVREYKGSHSGEHGDGLVRSEFHLPMFGERLVRAFREVKAAFDPGNRLNPGKIVDATRMDDRALFRFKPGYAALPVETALDWSEWGGLLGAAEMCNNNGTCRRRDASVMCPSYRVTLDEQHVTRGRANVLRLALTGQLGPDALGSRDMLEAMSLCVSCKACRRECPTGVDMARMKIEVLHRHHREHGVGLRDRLVSGLPRYAPAASRLAPLLALRERSAAVAGLVERMTGLDRRRSFPAWHRRPFRDAEADAPAAVSPPAGEVALLADTFGRWFEPGALRDAVALLRAAGYRVTALRPLDGGRPLCCGRTFLSCGLVDEGREEIRRLVEAALPAVRRGATVVGLEPSCLLTLRDEARAALPGPATEEVASRALLLEEFAAAERGAGRMALPLGPAPWRKALLHGHCHQKAFDAFAPVEQVLRLVPGLEVAAVTSSCCGMAGAFGYDREHYDVSMRMAESALLPAVRAADADTVIVADGTSCRHQIRDGAGREAVHAVSVLRAALRPGQA